MKKEESLIGNENLFFGYAKAILSGESVGGNIAGTLVVARYAEAMVKEHRKRFPDATKRDAPPPPAEPQVEFTKGVF